MTEQATDVIDATIEHLERCRETALFRCNVCGEALERKELDRTWLPSYCTVTGKNARLYRIKP
jgi:hypothetical protein